MSTESKCEIMNAAIKLFSTKGFEDTSIADIVEASKVHQSTIYRSFKNKEFILVSIFEKFWDLLLKDFEDVYENPWNASPIEQIQRMLTAAQFLITQNIDLVKIIAKVPLPAPESFEDPDLKEIRLSIRTKNRRFLEIIDSIISKGQNEKLITSELEPQVIRQMIIGTFQTIVYGIFVQFKDDNTGVGYNPAKGMKGVDFLLKSFLKEKK